MPTNTELLKKIPRAADGKTAASPRLREIEEQLRLFRFTPAELDLFAQDIELEIARIARGEPEPKACRICKCTEARACLGGCAWSAEDPEVCTACVERGALTLVPASKRRPRRGR